MTKQMIKLPYGLSDFKRVNKENWYYIDKTRYIIDIDVVLVFKGWEMVFCGEV